ncbi:hypothetical protein ACF08N_37425 [Streptomyces sp. NPDC015127]|uniref:hypothetical protein n=1 Tax=Streptomyces sp. NPDC015127 TaxID=3364939 RepID=UPI0036F75703
MDELILPNSRHLGDIDYDVSRNALYVALEPGGHAAVWEILLRATGNDGVTNRIRYLDVSGTKPQGYSAPWCAVNPGDGLLYSSVFGGVDEQVRYMDRLYAYDRDRNFELARIVRLPPGYRHERVQGGAFGKFGHLYLSIDSHPKRIAGYSIPSGGDTAHYLGYALINAPDLEVEGITVGPPGNYVDPSSDLSREWVHVGCLRNNTPFLHDAYIKHYWVPNYYCV